MKKIVLVFCVSVFLILCGCSKPGPTGVWSGSYINIYGSTDSFSSVHISYTGNNSADVVFKLYEFSYVYSAVTLHNVTLTGTTATFAQKQHIIETTDLGPYQITGNMSLSGNQVTLTATATNLTTNNPGDTKNFQFTGIRAVN